MNQRDLRTLTNLVKIYGLKNVRSELDKMDGGTLLGFPVILVDDASLKMKPGDIVFGDFSCWVDEDEPA